MQPDDRFRVSSRENFHLHGLRQNMLSQRPPARRRYPMLVWRLIAAVAIAAAYFFLLPHDPAPSAVSWKNAPEMSKRMP